MTTPKRIIKDRFEYRKEKDLSIKQINRLGKFGWRLKSFGLSGFSVWYFFERIITFPNKKSRSK